MHPIELKGYYVGVTNAYTCKSFTVFKQQEGQY